MASGAALARADHQVVLAGEDDGERERAAAAAAARALAASTGARPSIELVADQVHDRLGVGLGLEDVALGGQLGLAARWKFSMMPLCTTATRSFMCGWALRSVGLPCVAQRVWPMPVRPLSGSFGEPQLQVLELALGAAALEMAVLDGGDAGRVVAAIFEPAQRVDEIAGAPPSARECRRCRTCAWSRLV